MDNRTYKNAFRKSNDILTLVTIFLILLLGFVYAAIFLWDSAIYWKLLFAGLFSGGIALILGALWETAVDSDKNKLKELELNSQKALPVNSEKPTGNDSKPFLVKCPNCGNEISRNKIDTCWKCGKFVPNPKDSNVDVVNCVVCGEPQDRSKQIYCSQCSTKLPEKMKKVE